MLIGKSRKTMRHLCRVNQLYADYYVCGYMDYEEAMDASPEKSLASQRMYGSWEEMMDAYMLGFQFWKGDLAVTEDSPTRESYHYYEMLSSLEDSPFTLDWNMELKKSWLCFQKENLQCIKTVCSKHKK